MLRTVTSPPSCLASRWQIARPSPVPRGPSRGAGSDAVERLEQAATSPRRSCRCRYRSTSRLEERLRRQGGRSHARSSGSPPCSVNLMALSSRFTRICWIRSRSVAIAAGRSASELGLELQAAWLPPCAERFHHVGDDLRHRAGLPHRREAARPRSARGRAGRRSSARSTWPCSWIVAEVFLDLGGPALQEGMLSRAARRSRAARSSGVRISWLTFERNSLLARLACSAAPWPGASTRPARASARCASVR